MVKLVVKEAEEQGEELKTIAEREYESDKFTMPEREQMLEVPEREDNRFIVQNVLHHLGDDSTEVHLIVRTEEAVVRELKKRRREQRKQKKKQMQQMKQMQNQIQPPGGGGNGGGGNNPFSV